MRIAIVRFSEALQARSRLMCLNDIVYMSTARERHLLPDPSSAIEHFSSSQTPSTSPSPLSTSSSTTLSSLIICLSSAPNDTIPPCRRSNPVHIVSHARQIPGRRQDFRQLMANAKSSLAMFDVLGLSTAMPRHEEDLLRLPVGRIRYARFRLVVKCQDCSV